MSSVWTNVVVVSCAHETVGLLRFLGSYHSHTTTGHHGLLCTWQPRYVLRWYELCVNQRRCGLLCTWDNRSVLRWYELCMKQRRRGRCLLCTWEPRSVLRFLGSYHSHTTTGHHGILWFVQMSTKVCIKLSTIPSLSYDDWSSWSLMHMTTKVCNKVMCALCEPTSSLSLVHTRPYVCIKVIWAVYEEKSWWSLVHMRPQVCIKISRIILRNTDIGCHVHKRPWWPVVVWEW
jgi:hypothetical protein